MRGNALVPKTLDTSGHGSPEALGYYDLESSSWRTSLPTSEEGSTLSAQTFPVSGTTCRGRLYALPTSAPRTNENDCSFLRLFPTPNTGESPNGHGRRGGSARNGHQSGVDLDAVVKTLSVSRAPLFPTPTAKDAARRLLPTPRARDGKGAGYIDDLPNAVTKLFPTPRASDANGAGGHGDGGPDLRTVVSRLDGWGEYEPAVRHWETVFGRYAPEPTTEGRGGKRVLSPAFVEWMMGLPEGLVSGHSEVPRTKQIRLLGNGVVPQQAEYAIRSLLTASREE